MRQITTPDGNLVHVREYNKDGYLTTVTNACVFIHKSRYFVVRYNNVYLAWTDKHNICFNSDLSCGHGDNQMEIENIIFNC